MPGSSEYDASGGVQDPAAAGPRGPGPHDQIPPNKPPWFDQPHPVAPWGQQQVFSQTWVGRLLCGSAGWWWLAGEADFCSGAWGGQVVGTNLPHLPEGGGVGAVSSQDFMPIPAAGHPGLLGI